MHQQPQRGKTGHAAHATAMDVIDAIVQTATVSAAMPLHRLKVMQ